MYTNASPLGVRPNYDVVLMIKLLVLQQWYGLSDPELERQAMDRISFRHFLGYPETIPDRSMIWLFRERLEQTGKDTAIWEEFQRQLDAQGLAIKRGVIQDATFITADPGHASADTPRGDQAQTRRSRDGTWAKKGTKSQFGYKLHILLDKDNQLIRRIETTTASLHDSKVDLSREGETVYRDKGYFGVKPQASMDKTMHRAVRGHPLSIKENRRNKAISRTRSLVEQPFAVIKRVFHAGPLMVTTVARVRVKNTVSCMNFNFRQLLR
ncbi:IS5 family transposase [Methanofollis tationis]|uniref:IS5 family transposase n=1 Tax=Methanofollis tationis TaxID=81417 RepID=A0A7K4HNM5_9EURY|nr:IS5 family transposase [Methanofollis tationis]